MDDAWTRIVCHPKATVILEHVRKQREAELCRLTLRELVNVFRLPMGDDKYYDSISDSVRIILRWIKDQGFEEHNFITSVVSVIDRVQPKKNTICLVGESNSGKSVIIANPLKELCKFVGVLSVGAVSSEFMFQECVNKRLIAIDELLLPREQLQIMKLVLGGESLYVNTKHSGASHVRRAPTIFTGNQDLWALDMGSATAFNNRSHRFETRALDWLKTVKKVHPKAWGVLIDRYC